MNENITTFETGSSGYRDFRPRYPGELYATIARHVPAHTRAWDCGCGNGQAAIDLTDYFNAIDATDISENQLIHGFKHEKIHYSVRSAEKSGFPDNHFNLVCAAQCLHWFDLDRFFPEVMRVLTPGGIFACWGYGFFSIHPTVDTLIRNALMEKIAPFWAEENRIDQSGFLDITFPFTQINIPEIEMKCMWNADQLCKYLNTWSAVIRYNRHNSTDIISSIKPVLDVYIPEPLPVIMDFSLYIGKNPVATEKL